MNVGICMCVVLATLTTGSLSLPSQRASQEAKRWALLSESLSPTLTLHSHQARLAPPSGQLTNYNHQPLEDTDSIKQLLAKLLSGRGSLYQTRSSLTSRASGLGASGLGTSGLGTSGLSASHRIKDRDYVGWMDFGRRSAEEYEYS